MVLWGVTCVCQGLVTDFSGLAAVRWFLGLFEAGLFPGMQMKCSLGARSTDYFKAATFTFLLGTEGRK